VNYVCKLTSGRGILVTLGYVWIDGTEWNGMEWNKMEWSGTERNGIEIQFHCLDIFNMTK
jgi:hypothetical protein